MKRRSFLQLVAGAASSLSLMPHLMATNLAPAGRVLVLVELTGGNDGLNTLVPFADPLYRKLRPGLALPSSKVLRLSDKMAMHPNLKGLMDTWSAGELAWIQGVGYPEANRSHFRSIDIWETASNADDLEEEGWLARGLGSDAKKSGLVLGDGDPGPLLGQNFKSLVIKDPERFVIHARRLKAARVETSNPALKHVLSVQEDIVAGVETLEGKLTKGPALSKPFGKGLFARQLELATRLILAEVPVSVIKVTHKGFDTHAQQLKKHARLMKTLGDDLGAMRDNLKRAGRFQDVLIMTYSEFGRRAAQNGSGGTDHGTAAPHLLMGGRVKGGLLGKQPSLKVLEKGDLRYEVDFRRLYATVLERWWGVRAKPVVGDFAPLSCLPG